MDLICTEFLAQYGAKHPNKGLAIKRFASMLERTFDVKLIIVDGKDSVVYGEDLVSDLESTSGEE